MNKMYLPTVGPQDWQKLLADPEKQWRTGVRNIAYAWEAAKGHFPPEVESIFPEAGDERVSNLVLANKEMNAKGTNNKRLLLFRSFCYE
jgi:Domain of unknown function (DUF6946)